LGPAIEPEKPSPNSASTGMGRAGMLMFLVIYCSFWGGFAVAAVFGDGFSGTIEVPKKLKKP
jgi:hypothetical protein